VIATQETRGVMQRLRDETREHHQRAENRSYEQALIRGTLPRATYVEGLSQRYLIHAAIESAVRRLAETRPRLAVLIDSVHQQAPHARADLAFFGLDPATIAPRRATRRALEFLAKLEAENPVALLGAHYVFEGSKNGARYIARSLRKAYALDADGLRYLDPHGDQQRPVWESFKQKMESASFPPPEIDAILAAAKATFDLVAELDDELYPATRSE
jgi:heme oxygenase